MFKRLFGHGKPEVWHRQGKNRRWSWSIVCAHSRLTSPFFFLQSSPSGPVALCIGDFSLVSQDISSAHAPEALTALLQRGAVRVQRHALAGLVLLAVTPVVDCHLPATLDDTLAVSAQMSSWMARAGPRPAQPAEPRACTPPLLHTAPPPQGQALAASGQARSRPSKACCRCVSALPYRQTAG